MYRLDAALHAALVAGRTVIVPNRQRAAAVRLAHAWQQSAAGRRSWSTPDVIAWEPWLARELARARQRLGEGPVLLNVSQQHVLWQQQLDRLADSPEESALLRAHAEAVASAAALAREWDLTWPVAGATDEAALLARALQAMDSACRERGVLAVALARAGDFATLQPVPLAFAGFQDLTPRQRQVAARFARSGHEATVLPPDGSPAGTRALSFGNAAGELAAAGAWCRERLAADASARLLVICADGRLDAAALRNGIEELLDPSGLERGGEGQVAVEGGEPLRRQPLVSAAMAVLGAGGADLDFRTLGNLILSPFVGLGTEGECIRLELWLRERLPQRTARAAAVDQLGRAPAECEQPARRLGQVLEAVGAFGAAGRLLPLDWAMRFSDVLRLAGHPGGRPASSEELQAWQRWQGALEEFSSLGGLTGTLGATEALGRLQALLERAQHQASTGDAAVTVTRWREDPVVGYDGIWVMGLSEAHSPEPPRPDAFIPLALQRAAGLPQASSATRLAAARAQRAAWGLRAANELVLSHPRTEDDLDLEASVLLYGAGVIARDDVRRPWLQPGGAKPLAAEPYLPAIASPGTLRAGSKLPELQRECPFRAQAELRLGARGLATPRVGIDPRLRGQLLHRALERLWNQIRSGAALRARPTEAWQPHIDAAVVAALSGVDAELGAPPSARELQREGERCAALLREALELEARRGADFEVLESELKVTWPVAGAKLSLRIDRIDRLADGGRAIIDYKSGASAFVDLLGDTPRPVQLLAYLDALAGPAAGGDAQGDISALALLKLVPGATEFRAVEDGRAGIPVPRGAAHTQRRWDEQLVAWRADVQGLVARHLAGEAAVRPLPRACEHCSLPGLCRIDSQALSATLDAPSTEEEGGAGPGADDE